jgi:PhnB protein
MVAKSIPAGYHTVTPYLVVPGAAGVIDFVKAAFGAQELKRDARPDGTIRHAEVKIGDSVVMLGEATEEWSAMPAMLHLYVEDVDRVYRQALQAGATELMAPADQPHGDRMGGVRDSSGNQWWLATPIDQGR